MFLDRRKGDRRASGKRPDAERRTGNSGQDRRKWACGILYQTNVHMHDIEQWLLGNAKGRWGVGLESFDEVLSTKVLKMMFESNEDKDAFVQHFSQK